MENPITPEFLESLKGGFQLLDRMKTNNRKIDTVQVHLSGYEDVMFLVADIVKVCILALEGETDCLRIPEPTHNISGVLALVLDLLPYEEMDLLDKIREQMLNPVEVKRDEQPDYLIENYYLTQPTTNEA
jgi:hypothetical protein